MAGHNGDVLIAGHVCLDITPSLADVGGDLKRLLVPGTLVRIGAATVSTGGVVPNVGIPLKRLGASVRLAGKIGDDELGRVILSILSRHGLDAGMIVSPGQETSYTIVIAPPGVDRMFLHHTGANDTFVADDLLGALDPPPRLVHFGYPTLMRRMYLDGGKELVKLLSGVRRAGAVVTMDVSQPDPSTEAGRQDWREILSAALPHVDVFMPSLEESLFLLDPKRFASLGCEGPKAFFAHVGADGVSELARQILDLGAAVAVVTCGSCGLCVRTGSAEALAPVAQRLGLDLAAWKDRTVWAEAVAVEKIVSTTGAGDCSVAGFLAALSRGEGVETAARFACAVGGQNITAMDTVSGVRSYEETLEQLATSSFEPLEPVPSGWRHLPTPGLWSPGD